MNALWLALAALAVFALGWRYYSRYIAERIYRLEPGYRTPAHRFEDGVDYVPTRKWVLWGHHFTSVAGAAPIVGPAIAMYWGWGPALAWVVLGTVFAAGVHDFGALVLSVRHKGQSVGTLTERLIGRRARLLFLCIILMLVLMVNAVFTWLVAKLFISNPATVLPVALQIPVAIWFGYTVIRHGKPMLGPSLLALVLMYGTALLSTRYDWLQVDLAGWFGQAGAGPLWAGLDAGALAFLAWIVVLLVYVYFASTLPVWKLLQPRDYINAQQLVFGLLILYGGLALSRPEVTAPVYNPGAEPGWFPLLFITIACGAISGFHGLIASGTTSKQLDKETDARAVGYLGALGEGTLALITIVAVATVFEAPEAFQAAYGSFAAASAGGLGHFITGAAHLAEGLGIPHDVAATLVSLIIVCFALTSLDSAVRLLRYIIGELAVEYGQPRLAGRHPATSLAVGLTALLVLLPEGERGFGSGGYLLWPLFGTSNQLLAGITLMLISVWLVRSGRNPLPTLLPMVFLLSMTLWAMGRQVFTVWSGAGETEADWLLFTLGALVLGFAVWILAEASRLLAGGRAPAARAQEDSSP